MKSMNLNSSLTEYFQEEGAFCVESSALPSGIIIFGASGDLAFKKLFPALMGLFSRGLLHKKFFILGVSRTQFSDQDFRTKLIEKLNSLEKFNQNDLESFVKNCFYVRLNYSETDDYMNLYERVRAISDETGVKDNYLFYSAVPPTLHEVITKGLNSANLLKTKISRIIYEKPFGSDYESALVLSRKLSESLEEDQIYRIDHYLGKETVQNILMLRFANLIFEPIWNRNYIDHIQITAAESIGIGKRAGYYDKAGQIRDMFQNHMLQLLALVTMEPPNEFNATHIRNQKLRLLETLKIDSESLVTGQYQGYLSETDVAENSNTETYAAFKAHIENWRWKDVPIYMRSGKALAQKSTTVSIVFKKTPLSIFRPGTEMAHPPNILVLRIQPDEGFDLFINGKVPGPKLCMSTLKMDFDYKGCCDMKTDDNSLPDAYERLLLDALLKDQTLFIRTDDLLESWKKIMPLLNLSSHRNPDIYEVGSYGPEKADELIRRDQRTWINL